MLNQILTLNQILENDLLSLHGVIVNPKEVNLVQIPLIEEEEIVWEERGTPQSWVESMVEEEAEEFVAISNYV